MLGERWRAWREANPADARRLLRGGAVADLVALLVLMVFYPHGLYLLGVVIAVLVALRLLYADWKA
jgi:hypothetical protein